jgi:hypothetical protein
LPCCAFAFSVWQLVHAAWLPSDPLCPSWQLVQVACPFGAEPASAAWQVAQDGFFVGAWGSP